MDENDVKNAVVFTADVLKETGSSLPLYGLLGETMTGNVSTDSKVSKDSRLWLNMNNPFSAFVCGLQGSGKSHSLSCILGKLRYNDCVFVRNAYSG